MSERTSDKVTEPTTGSMQRPENPDATMNDLTLAEESMELDETARFSNIGPDRVTSPAYGVTRSSAKPSSSSSSETKEVETADEETFDKQMELLDHLSKDPSMWSEEVLQAIVLNHLSTIKEMNEDADQDWKLVRNDSLHQTPLAGEDCIRQRIIMYTRLDRDVRVRSFIHLYDPSDKSIYLFISNEAGYEQTVNLDCKAKVWEKRVQGQRSQLIALEKEMAGILNDLSITRISRSQSETLKKQRNRMLNILCTMSVILFKELVYTGLIILNSKDCCKEFNRLKKERDDYLLKTQSQLIMTVYEGLSYLNRNGFEIPQLRKDYFVRESERCEAEEQLMVHESKQLVKRLKKAHEERSGILTLENPSEVTAELTKLLGEVKKLKRETPVTLQDLEAQNMERFTNKVAEVLAETLGKSLAASETGTQAAPTPLGASALSTASTVITPMQPARLFQTPEMQSTGPQKEKTKSKSLSPEEQQELHDDILSLKRILSDFPGVRNPSQRATNVSNIQLQKVWSAATLQIGSNVSDMQPQRIWATPQTELGQPTVNQGAFPRSSGGFGDGSALRPLTSRRPVLETVKETTGAGKSTEKLLAQEFNLEPPFDYQTLPPTEGRKAVPLKVRDLQEQLQQLRLGPTVASTPLRTPRAFKGVVEPPTPIIKPNGTIPKPGINRTELDNNYRPAVAQPGSAKGGAAPVETQSSSTPEDPPSFPRQDETSKGTLESEESASTLNIKLLLIRSSAILRLGRIIAINKPSRPLFNGT